MVRIVKEDEPSNGLRVVKTLDNQMDQLLITVLKLIEGFNNQQPVYLQETANFQEIADCPEIARQTQEIIDTMRNVGVRTSGNLRNNCPATDQKDCIVS